MQKFKLIVFVVFSKLLSRVLKCEYRVSGRICGMQGDTDELNPIRRAE